MTHTITSLGPFAKDIAALTKPRITLTTLIVAIGSMGFARTPMALTQIIFALLGVALLVSGSSAFNMYIERDYDALMLRTQSRPLPSGRLSPQWALAIGWILSLLALPILYFGTNPLTLILGFASLIIYVLVYTPMKRQTSLALFVGAIPGAMPALMGYTAATGAVDLPGILIFSILFFWQLPHFIAISIYRGQEYTNAGYPMLPDYFGLFGSKIAVFATAIMLVLSSMTLWWFQIGGFIYQIASSLCGLWFIIICLSGFVAKDSDAWSKKVFVASLKYQVVLFLVLAIDLIVQGAK